MSFRLRLTVLNSAILALTLIVFSVALYVTVSRVTFGILEDTLTGEAQRLTDQARFELHAIDYPARKLAAPETYVQTRYLNGTIADRLVRASTPVAEKVQVHQEIDDNGVMKMRELPVVDIGPGAALTFKPGGTHMMIIGLKQPLKKGETFPLTLEFENAGKIDLQVPIAKAGAMGDRDMSGM